MFLIEIEYIHLNLQSILSISERGMDNESWNDEPACECVLSDESIGDKKHLKINCKDFTHHQGKLRRMAIMMFFFWSKLTIQFYDFNQRNGRILNPFLSWDTVELLFVLVEGWMRRGCPWICKCHWSQQEFLGQKDGHQGYLLMGYAM